MAAVTSDDDRGQLILVAAIGLAVTLVALVLILNSAIYTENLATRDIDSGASDAITTRGDVKEGLGGVMNGVNGQSPPSDYGSLKSNFDDDAEAWSINASRYGALRGQAVRVTGTTAYGGVRIVDDDSTTAFQPYGSSDVDWIVAPDVRARAFTITPHGFASTTSQTTVKNTIDDANPTGFFFVDIDDGDAQPWRMAVYNDGSTTKVTVYDGSSPATCSAEAGTPITVDVGAGTVNGIPCPALSSVAEQDGLYTIAYRNGGEITGTYELTVDRGFDDSDLTTEASPFTDAVDVANDPSGNQCSFQTYASPNDGTSGASPYVTPAIYSGTADVDFQGQTVQSSSTIRIADRELAEGASAPHITAIIVDDKSDPSVDTKFEVTVVVADPDGDLSGIDVKLSQVSGGYSSSQPPKSVSGKSATEKFTFDPTVPIDTKFEIVVTVTDDEPNSRTVRQQHVSDGESDDDTAGTCAP